MPIWHICISTWVYFDASLSIMLLCKVKRQVQFQKKNQNIIHLSWLGVVYNIYYAILINTETISGAIYGLLKQLTPLKVNFIKSK